MAFEKYDTPMQTSSCTWFCRFNAKKESVSVVADLETLSSSILSYYEGGFVAMIIHDQEDERPHLHAYIETTEKKTKRKFLDELVELLDIDEQQVGIQSSNNSYLPVQYLIHKNDESKHPYDKTLIKTNDLTELENRLSKQYEKPKTAIEQFKDCKSVDDLINTFGLKDAKTYFSIWKAWTEENKKLNNYDMLMKQHDATLEELNETQQELLRYKYENERLKNALESYKNIELYKK